jgi:hypothetical protein
MTPGQEAYERDLQQRPFYHDGGQRKTWEQLGDVERWSWERNPTNRLAAILATKTAYQRAKISDMIGTFHVDGFVLADCNDLGVPYFRKIGGKKLYTLSAYRHIDDLPQSVTL